MEGVRPPGKTGLSFDVILSRLNGSGTYFPDWDNEHDSRYQFGQPFKLARVDTSIE
jgi:hypothetical protein